jgi:2-keto-3-deoxy-L-rhamnonate aldolase RhmA
MAPDYVATCAGNLLVALQIESAKGVANIDQILAVEGIDAVFIGPHDLSGTVGQLGNLKHPEVAALIARRGPYPWQRHTDGHGAASRELGARHVRPRL